MEPNSTCQKSHVNGATSCGVVLAYPSMCTILKLLVLEREAIGPPPGVNPEEFENVVLRLSKKLEKISIRFLK